MKEISVICDTCGNESKYIVPDFKEIPRMWCYNCKKELLITERVIE